MVPFAFGRPGGHFDTRATGVRRLRQRAAGNNNERVIESENAREKDSAKHLDLALREKRVALREKATNTRDKRLELLEFERAKILERAKVAETNVALLQSSLEKVEKQNQKYLEQLRALRKRDVEADRYMNRAYYY